MMPMIPMAIVIDMIFFLSEVYHYDNNENSGENGYKNSEYEKDIECYSEYNKTDYNRKIERKK